ncbi:MAG: LCP family protein [Solibacillus sp.]
MDAITIFSKKSLCIWLIPIFFCSSGLGGYQVFTMYSEVQQTIDDIYIPLRTKNTVSTQIREPFSILLLGVDERGTDAGRSDAIVVLTVNPQLETTQMLSIPRDTRVEIAGKGIRDKINHAYAFGGTQMAVETVEQFLEIPIQYVVRVNMESFTELIDIVGGITVDNAFVFDYEGAHFSKGELILDGERALQYVRMRFDDPNGDFGRQTRQRQVLKGLVEQGMSLDTLFRYEKILQVIHQHVEMNLTKEDIERIQKNYSTSLKHIETLSFREGYSERIRGIYYYMPDATELEGVQQVLQTHLQLP